MTRKPINLGMQVSTRFKALAKALKMAVPISASMSFSFHHTAPAFCKHEPLKHFCSVLSTSLFLHAWLFSKESDNACLRLMIPGTVLHQYQHSSRAKGKQRSIGVSYIDHT